MSALNRAELKKITGGYNEGPGGCCYVICPGYGVVSYNDTCDLYGGATYYGICSQFWPAATSGWCNC